MQIPKGQGQVPTYRGVNVTVTPLKKGTKGAEPSVRMQSCPYYNQEYLIQAPKGT